MSRTAESLFAIGRHLERSDGAARLLDVHLQLLLEDPWVEEAQVCRALPAVLGSAGDDDPPLTRADVLALLTVDRSHPASIASELGAAREHARRARGAVPTDLWECLTATRARLPRKVAADKVHEFLDWVRERAALAVGIVESATSRDDSWALLTLGRSLERAGLTARVLASPALGIDPVEPLSEHTWATILRSCGAYEAYLRAESDTPSASAAARFLLSAPRFPRSLLFSLNRAEECMEALAPEREGRGRHGDALAALERARAHLVAAPVASLAAEMPGLVARIDEAAELAADVMEHCAIAEGLRGATALGDAARAQRVALRAARGAYAGPHAP